MPISNNIEGVDLASIEALANNQEKSISTEQAEMLKIEGAETKGSLQEAVQQHLNEVAEAPPTSEPEQKLDSTKNVDGSEKKPEELPPPDDEQEEEPDPEEARINTEVEKRLNERFDAHPRFKELVAERDSLKPLAENAKLDAQFCQQHNIVPEQKKAAMDMCMLLNTNPDKALPILEKLVNDIKLSTGKLLPDDLAKEVSEGTMSQARATELHMARMQLQQREQAAKVQQTNAQQTHLSSMRNAMSQAGTLIAKTNPDFKPKKDASARDGVYELTESYIKLLAMENYPKTVEEAVTLVNNSYAKAKSVFVPTPTARPRRTLRSTDVSSSAIDKNLAPRDGETMTQFTQRYLKQNGHAVGA